ncbi:hypothetical protein [Persephonella sp.]
MNKEELIQGFEKLKKIIKLKKELFEEKKELLEPLKNKIKKIDKKYSGTEEELKEKEKSIRDAINFYKNEIEPKKKAEIAEKFEKGEITFEQSVEMFKEVELDLKFSNKKEVFVEDLYQIPRDYLIPDIVKIKEDIKKGKKISGIKIKELKIIRVK